jgi:hypothetical protein
MNIIVSNVAEPYLRAHGVAQTVLSPKLAQDVQEFDAKGG